MVVIIAITYSAIALLLFLLAWTLLRKERLSLKERVTLAVWLYLWPLLFPIFVWSWFERISLMRRSRRIRQQKAYRNLA